MTYFPVLERLRVSNYGLYPGASGDGMLDVEFKTGLTVILGANGLGKSTLIQLLFRLLTGPFDISLPEGSVGTAELKHETLNKKRVLAFAARVLDAAIDAKASLKFSLGQRHFEVTRSLRDLSLDSYAIDGVAGEGEHTLQTEILAASGVGTFGEFIYLLRTMVFFFEDRRQLVWDPSAQRQLLRQLLLTREQSAGWSQLEREILSLDTRMRNLQAALRREQREDAEAQSRSQAAPGVRAALKQLEEAQATLSEQQEALISEVENLDALRHEHRLKLLRSESEAHDAVHELERARLAAVESRFPNLDVSMRYIFSQLMTDDLCNVCQTPGRAAIRDQLIAAVDSRHCIVCSAELGPDAEVVDISDERIAFLQGKLEQASSGVQAARQLLVDSTTSYDKVEKELSRVVAVIADNKVHIDALVRQLPSTEQAARKQHGELTNLSGRVVALRAEIRTKREQFAISMATYRQSIRAFADAIKQAFDTAAGGFLLESSALTWSPTRAYVGQAGADGLDPIEYPAFAIEMSGANFGQAVRREGPDQVSESQREFIDLAFRMALIQVVAPDQAATILIDAPESSLDAVFVKRAADVLAKFANATPLNRLIATSNLAAGKLIPAMLNAAEPSAAKRRDRIIDLFELGVPTRAMRELNDEYESLRMELFQQIGADHATAQ